MNENKDLLLKYLSMALPYGVKFLRESWNYEWDQEMSVIEVLEDIDKDGYINNTKVYSVEDIKPFLRSMQSMTDDEWKDFQKIRMTDWVHDDINGTFINAGLIVNWLLEHHFDFMGLIPKGLSIEVTDGNNPYKE